MCASHRGGAETRRPYEELLRESVMEMKSFLGKLRRRPINRGHPAESV